MSIPDTPVNKAHEFSDAPIVLKCIYTTASPSLRQSDSRSDRELRQVLPSGRRNSLCVLTGSDSNSCALMRSEEHTYELQSRGLLDCRLLVEKTTSTKSESY